MSARRLASVIAIAMLLPITMPLVPLAAAAGAPTPSLPEFAVLVAPSGAFHSGEPTVGVNWETNAMMYHSSSTTYKVVANLEADPVTASWTDVTPANSITNIDPMLFTDIGTGRTFAGGLNGECSIMSFTDNDGGDWTPVGNMCAGAIDHQTVGQGAWASPPPIGMLYDRATYYCAQGWVSFPQNACATSLDGGLTFLPPVMWEGDCFGLHGHVNVSPTTGTAFVPTRDCNGKPGSARSTDNGATWEDFSIATSNTPGNGFDPSVGVSGGGRVWFAYENPSWLPYVAYSDADGADGTFTLLNKNIGADAGIQTATFLRVIAGDNDRIAVAYLGSTTDGSPFVSSWPGVWDLYISFTYDSGATWSTVKVTSDPVQRGWMCAQGLSCTSGRNLLDFMGSTLDKEGNVIVAYPDGCIGACASAFGTASQSTNSWPSIARQVGGKGLFAAYDDGSVTLSAVTGTFGVPATLAGVVTLSKPYSVDINWGDGSSETVSGLTESALSLTHTYASPGSYTITADGTGQNGDEASASSTATISGGIGNSVIIDEPTAGSSVGAAVNVVGRVVGDGGNLAPTAAFDFVVTGDTVAFDGTDSSDPENGALAFAWDFDDGMTGAGASPSHTYASPGTYDVCLTVADAGGLTDDACASVTIAGQASVDLIAEDPEGDEAANSFTGANVPAMDILKLEITKNIEQEPVFIMTVKDLSLDPPVTEAGNGIYWAVDWTSPDGSNAYVQLSVTTAGAEPMTTCVYGIIESTQGQNLQTTEGTATCSTTLGPNGKIYLTYPTGGLAAHQYTANSVLNDIVGAAGTVLDVPDIASGFFAYDTTAPAAHQLHSAAAPWQVIGLPPAHVAQSAPQTPPSDPEVVDNVADPIGDNSPVGNVESAWFDADADNLYVGLKVADIPADSTATAFTYFSVNFEPAYAVEDSTWGTTGDFTGLRVTALFSPVAFSSLPSVPHTETGPTFELQVLSTDGTSNSFSTRATLTGSVNPDSDIIWWIVPRALLQDPPGGGVLEATSATAAPAVGGAVTFGGILADTTGTGESYAFPTVQVVPPTVTLSAAPAAGTAPLSVTFAPSVTPASMASWTLDFGDNTPDATGTTSFPTLTHVYEGVGTFHAVLTVTAPDGGVGTGAADITVGSTQLPPVAVRVSAGNLPAVTATCTANCAEWDADLDLGSLPDGEVTITATLYVNGAVADIDSVVVDLSTAVSQVAIDSPAANTNVPVGSTIDVLGRIAGSTNLPPEASLNGDVANGLAPLAVQFTLGGDDDAGIAGWRFTSGDGRIVDGTAILPIQISHTYTAAGTYYPAFRVTDTNGVEDTATGQIIVQAQNTPPTVPSAPIPANGATGASLAAVLGWTSTDADGTTVTADVYLDTVDGTTLVASDQTGSYMPTGLVGSTTYFWHVVVSDGVDSVTGPTWSFTTRAPVLNESQRPHVVVALIDTGTTPYHQEFRRPGMVENPSTYITGLPASQLVEVDLCFYDAISQTVDQTRCPASLSAAQTADVSEWQQFPVSGHSATGAGQGKIAWFPGTNVMLVSFDHVGDAKYAGLDGAAKGGGDNHGTYTSSNVGGATTGTCPECIVIMIEADSVDAISAAYQWVSNQPWIDVITSSVSVGLIGVGANPVDFFEVNSVATKNAVTKGKLVFEAAGNGVGNVGLAPTSTYLYGNSNPWTIPVGCSADGTGQPCGYSDFPNPITASGVAKIGASTNSWTGTEGVGGTSFSSPSTAGVAARALYSIRSAMGDVGEGPKTNASHSLVRVAPGTTLPARGPLANGELTRLELEEGLFKTARRGLVPKVPTYLLPSDEIVQSPASFIKEGYGDVYRGDWGVGKVGAVASWASTPDIVNRILSPPATGAIWPNRLVEETWWEQVIEPTQILLYGAEVPDSDGSDSFPMNSATAPAGLQGYSGPAFGFTPNTPSITAANADVPTGVVPSPTANRVYLHHANLGPDPTDPVNDLIEFYMNTVVDPSGGETCNSEGCADQTGLGGTGGGTAAQTQSYELNYPRLGGIALLDRTQDVVLHIEASDFVGGPSTPLSLHVALKTGEALIVSGEATRIDGVTTVYELRAKPLVDAIQDAVILSVGWDGPVYSVHFASQGASYLDLPIQSTLPPVDLTPVKYYVDDVDTYSSNGGSLFLTRDATKIEGDPDSGSFFPFPQTGGLVINLGAEDALVSVPAVLGDSGTAHVTICSSTPAGAATFTVSLSLEVGNVPVGGGSITQTVAGADAGTPTDVAIPLSLHTALLPNGGPVTGTLHMAGPGGVFLENMGLCGGGAANPWTIELGYSQLASPSATVNAPSGTLSNVATLSGSATFPAAPAAADVKWYAKDFDTWDTQVQSFVMDTDGPGGASPGPIFDQPATLGGYVLTFTSARPVAEDAPALSSAGVASAHFWVLALAASPDVTVDFTVTLQNAQGDHRLLGAGSVTKHVMPALGEINPLPEAEFVISFTPAVTDPQPDERLVMVLRVTNGGEIVLDTTSSFGGDEAQPIFVSLPKDVSATPTAQAVDLTVGAIAKTVPVVNGAWSTTINTVQLANGAHTVSVVPHADYAGTVRTGAAATQAINVHNTQGTLNTPPTATLVVPGASGFAPLRVTAQIGGSDAQTPASQLAWSVNWGDGSPPSTGTGVPALAVHTYGVGNYNARVTITDGGGEMGASTSQPVSAFEAPPTRRVLVALGEGAFVEATDVTGDGSYAEWSASIPANVAGDHMLVAQEMRGSDTRSSASIPVHVFVPEMPVVQIDSPADGAIVAPGTEITGTVQFASGAITGVYASSPSTPPLLVTTSDGFATWSVSVDDLGLVEDTQETINVVATTANGNGGASIRLTLDAAPRADIGAVLPRLALADIDFRGEYTPSATGAPVASFAWTFGDGATSTDENPTHAYAHSGIYTVTLTVTDTNGRSGSVSTLVLILNNLPNMDIDVDTSNPTVQDVVTITTTASDVDGSIVSITTTAYNGADRESGVLATGADTLSLSFPDDGSYLVVGRAVDNEDGASEIETTIVVQNLRPIAILTADPTLVGAGQDVTLDASASSDPDGAVVEYRFDPGDGSGVSIWGNPSVMHTYATAGTFFATVTVIDDDGAADASAPVQIIVNAAPVLDAIGNKIVGEAESLGFTVTASDAENDALTFAADPLPAGATFDTQTGEFAWTPDFGTEGNYLVSFSVTDGLSTDSEPIYISVGNVDRPPVLDSIGDKLGAEQSLLSFTISATDPDTTDTLTFSATGLPSGANLNALTGLFTWTPSYTQAGTYPVTFQVSDGEITDSESVLITIANTDRAPTLTAFSAASVYQLGTLSIPFTATDADGDLITFAAMGVNGLSVENRGNGWGILHFTPTLHELGPYTVTMYALAGEGSTGRSAVLTVLFKTDATMVAVGEQFPGASPGEVVTLTARITNTGPQTDTFALGMDLTSALWHHTDIPSSVTLAAGESVLVSTEVTVPMNAAVVFSTITATSTGDSSTVRSVRFRIDVPVVVTLTGMGHLSNAVDLPKGTVHVAHKDETSAVSALVTVEQIPRDLGGTFKSTVSGVTNANGDFVFDFSNDPMALTPGEHQLTIKAKKAGGLETTYTTSYFVGRAPI